MVKLLGGIEAGGTKFVCMTGTGPDDIKETIRFPTSDPDNTIQQTIDFFRGQVERFGPIAAIGIGSFGPVDPNPRSPTYGYITSTPKPGWANSNFLGPIRDAFNVPVMFDTDVNAAALGEWQWGSARGTESMVYLTVGTGIGGGILIDGNLVHGLIHPEMGHIRIPHDMEADPFNGNCPFHGDCLEGLASGPAMEKRWGTVAENLSDDHPGWELEANYIALGLANFICTLSPQRIVLGGGVMNQKYLYPQVRKKVSAYLNGYIQSSIILDNIDSYIVPPGLGSKAGVLGALALAQRAAD